LVLAVQVVLHEMEPLEVTLYLAQSLLMAVAVVVAPILVELDSMAYQVVQAAVAVQMAVQEIPHQLLLHRDSQVETDCMTMSLLSLLAVAVAVPLR
jgi:hypothetical protein